MAANRAARRPDPEAAMTATPTASPKTAPTLEDLTFHPGEEVTVGVEIELQVLDRDTGELAPGSVRILQACAEEGLDGVTAEMMQSMIEIKTGVCQGTAEVRDSIFPVLKRVRHIAGSMGYDLALGGTHPFSKATANAVFPAERNQKIQDRMAFLAYQPRVAPPGATLGKAGF
jgi:carboxylate-amine ligase